MLGALDPGDAPTELAVVTHLPIRRLDARPMRRLVVTPRTMRTRSWTLRPNWLYKQCCKGVVGKPQDQAPFFQSPGRG